MENAAPNAPKMTLPLPKFRGPSIMTMDNKGRTPIPSDLFSVLVKRILIEQGVEDPDSAPIPEEIQVLIAASPNGNMAIFTPAYLEGLMGEMEKGVSGPYFRLHSLDALEVIVNTVRPLTLDKLRRFRIPDDWQHRLRITKGVSVVGVGDYIEVQSEEEYEASLTSRLNALKDRSKTLGSQPVNRGKPEPVS